ncbi:hypothetical protein ACVNIS_07630 [Sphaerotilaceae bacterium SBD11-9]
MSFVESFSTEFMFAAGVAAAAFLAGLLYLRSRTRRTRSVGLKVAGGPKNMRFKCAGCSGQFTHSRQTLSSWERGNRTFYCKACRTKANGEKRRTRR